MPLPKISLLNKKISSAHNTLVTSNNDLNREPQAILSHRFSEWRLSCRTTQTTATTTATQTTATTTAMQTTALLRISSRTKTKHRMLPVTLPIPETTRMLLTLTTADKQIQEAILFTPCIASFFVEYTKSKQQKTLFFGIGPL